MYAYEHMHMRGTMARSTTSIDSIGSSGSNEEHTAGTQGVMVFNRSPLVTAQFNTLYSVC